MSQEKQPLNALIVKDGDGIQDAVDLGHGIYMSRDVSNAYRVVTSTGDVIINTGIDFHADENHRRLSQVSDNPIAKIIFTQCHPDHIGGWRHFNEPGTDTIAQANFEHVHNYWSALSETMSHRTKRLWGADLDIPKSENIKPVVTTVFHDTFSFEEGGRRFELYSVPGGETLDSTVVWMPAERVVFTGNMTGPIFGHVPNLYTLRGDKIRYVQWFIDGVQRIIDLKPATLITGHGEPIVGEDNIQTQLSRIRDAVIYLRDRTFEGMNAGTDLWTLMGSIELPEHLAIGQGHGKTPWIVRAIWEEHLGWFRQESTTELYEVPPTAALDDLVELAGGAAPVLARAQDQLTAGKPLHAMHLADAVLRSEPASSQALEIKLAATEALLAESGRENFSEVRWLEAEIRQLHKRLEARG